MAQITGKGGGEKGERGRGRNGCEGLKGKDEDGRVTFIIPSSISPSCLATSSAHRDEKMGKEGRKH